MLFIEGTVDSEELGPSPYGYKAGFCLMTKVQFTFLPKVSSDPIYLG